MTEDDFKGLKLHRLIRTYACLTRRGPEPAFRGPFQHDGEERFYADINHHVGHHFCGAIEVCCWWGFGDDFIDFLHALKDFENHYADDNDHGDVKDKANADKMTRAPEGKIIDYKADYVRFRSVGYGDLLPGG